MMNFLDLMVMDTLIKNIPNNSIVFIVVIGLIFAFGRLKLFNGKLTGNAPSA